jgi:hypothetical protein
MVPSSIVVFEPSHEKLCFFGLLIFQMTEVIKLVCTHLPTTVTFILYISLFDLFFNEYIISHNWYGCATGVSI